MDVSVLIYVLNPLRMGFWCR